MRLKANLRHDNSKKPEQLNEREWTLFVAEVIHFPEAGRVMFNTGTHMDPPEGFRFIVDPHYSLTYHDLVLTGGNLHIHHGNEKPIMLIMAEVESRVEIDPDHPDIIFQRESILPGVGDPIAIIRLERLSERFTVECSGELPDKQLTNVSNFN